jgi:ribosomal protein S12 methylthiotransferase
LSLEPWTPRILEPLFMKKKVHILSLGCPKNQVDSEVMSALLAQSGYDLTQRPEEAHIILVNTCAFILPAKEESIEEILRMAEWKKKGWCEKLVVTGCLPQRYGPVLEAEMPEVDLFLGTGEVPRIARLIQGRQGKKQRSFIGKPNFLMDAASPRLFPPSTRSAYLKIAEGCSNRCSYCVIPSIRGAFRSRPMADILKEGERLAEMGIREVILIAQDTTAYGRDLRGKPSLGELLRELSSIGNLRWIRVLYAHPASITDEILMTVAGEEKICSYLDMPVQHMDDSLLKAMNRKSNGASIRGTIDRARAIIPGVTLRTSLIVGFPGETAKKFNALLEFVQEARFENLGVFIYSREEGTKAAELPARISERVKNRRRDILMEAQSAISFEINRSRIGSVEEVLLEEKSDAPEFPLVGRTRGQAPEVDGVTYVRAGKGKIGDIVSCRITGADTYDLYGEEIG